MSTSSLGFRPPQFSEDTAWLPPWLQPNQACRLDDSFNDAQTPHTQACKVQGNFALEKDVDLSAREDAGFNFRLLLSASDDSHVGMTPSGNLRHFHLYLSSNGTSQYTPSPTPNAIHTEKGESNDIPSMQPLPEIPACSKDGSCSYKLEVNSCVSNAKIKSKSIKSPPTKSVSKDGKSSRKKRKEKGNCRNLINADITDAVELSIAASEALAVSDIMNSYSSSETLQASPVLEVALRLKQARNQLCPTNLEDNSVTDMFDETELLQNLDEDIMADAYEDVGLFSKPVDTTPEDHYYPSPAPEHRCSLSGTSRVLDTPLSENHYEHKAEMQNVQLKSQEVESKGISNRNNFVDILLTESMPKDSPSESLLGARQEEVDGDQHLIVDTYSAEMHIESPFNQAAETNARVSTNQGTNTCTDNESLPHTQEGIHLSPWIHESRNDGARADAFYAVSDKFTSRWLGGWSGKDANVSGFTDLNVVNRQTKFVTRETSFISESAHTVQDENALIRKPELGQIIASMSSVACEGLCSTTNRMEVSQELMSSYNLSLADPLCSVVPCSISSSDANVNIDANQECVEKEADKCLNPVSKNGLEDIQLRTAGPYADSDGEEHMLIVEDSEVSTRRHFTSLQAYSMIGLPCKVDLERNASLIRSVPISEFHKFEENIDCFKSSSRKECSSYSKATSKSASVTDHGEDHETLGVELLNTKVANHKESDNEDRSSPLVLNRRARRRLRASKIVLSNDAKGVNQTASPPKDLEARGKLSLPDTTTIAPFPPLQSKRPNASVPNDLETRDELCFPDTTAVAPLPPLHSKRPNPCEDQGPRKRVRFLEDEATVLEPRSAQEPQSRYHTRSNARTSKRLKKSNHRPDLRPEENKGLKNCRSRDRKRMIFQGLEFLLTGFSYKKERELEMLIRKHGGFIVSDVPTPPCLGRKRRFKCKFQQLPILLSPNKLQTSKFLYGCAVNAFLLNMSWLTDSIMAGSPLPPDKYMLLTSQSSMKHKRIGHPVRCADLTYIFHNLGIMLHGKHSFCTDMGNLVKHGGGQVFKTLQWLVQSLKSGKISIGAIVIEDESSASRHLRHCAQEQKIPMMTANWIVESLLSRKLIPLKGNHLSSSSTTKIPEYLAMDYSEEI